jgi:hypothetical protein
MAGADIYDQVVGSDLGVSDDTFGPFVGQPVPTPRPSR